MSKRCILSLWVKLRHGIRSRSVRRLIYAGSLAGLFVAGAGAVLKPAIDTSIDRPPESLFTQETISVDANTAAAEFTTIDAGAPIVGNVVPQKTQSLSTKIEAPDPDTENQVAMLSDVTPVIQQVDTVQRLTVRSGDTLMDLLVKARIPRKQGHAAIQALRKLYNPRLILPGQKITVTSRRGEAEVDTTMLHKVALHADFERDVVIQRRDDGKFQATVIKHELRTSLVRSTGKIASSLYVAGLNAGIPPSILIELIRIYSWDVDFQRDIQPGDGFDIVFERLTTEIGEKVRDGAIIYAALQLGRVNHTLYRFVDKQGRSDYFDKNGQSARKRLLRTPLDGARLTSRYGRRLHPVLNYTRMHRGVDFAAAPGTPVYAAGNGRLVFRGRKGALGKFIKIRHNSQYQTAYAHLRSFRRGVTTGSRVKQGQVIGYVGSTGTVTGPHLHFEVLVGGRQVNPLKVRLPSGRKLKGKQLAKFNAMRDALTRRVADLPTQNIKISSN